MWLNLDPAYKRGRCLFEGSFIQRYTVYQTCQLILQFLLGLCHYENIVYAKMTCVPSSRTRAVTGLRVLVKTHGAEARPKGRQVNWYVLFPLRSTGTFCGLDVWGWQSSHLSDPPLLTNPLAIGGFSGCEYPLF